ncbi:MAG: hypothetical protein HeimC2_14170 [Candidatus Heimdallarchaeota archaeon LC_2]|nr:MAG: hypothetical protein HeimC2_14170 [Candidatus Heimdallarchaeota archaeon LC_2]
MELKINFSNLLADEIAKKLIIEVPQVTSVTLRDFLNVLKEQDWVDILIIDNHLKPSIVLIIDDQIIQFSNSSEMEITSVSEISFHIMFAGG